MRITVNGESVSIFAGATVADAVRAYLRTTGKRRPKIISVRDGHGHEVALDGELSGGAVLILDVVTEVKKKS